MPRSHPLILDGNTIEHKTKDKIIICDKETGEVLKKKSINKNRCVSCETTNILGFSPLINVDRNGCLNGYDVNTPTFIDLLYDVDGKFDDF